MSLALFPRHVPKAPAGIDLRCCGASELLDSLDDGIADLVVLDPPWDLYQQKPGVAQLRQGVGVSHG